uniref:Apple domain-containing protein n=1 Tax=Acrobeloides nanus TaxID=290746 RepID=A0A914E471_9BILA
MYAQGVTSAYRECMDRFINQDIEGQDMGAVGGQEYQCCGICQNTNGCKAYVWGNWNGGTCFLKSARGPIKSSSSGTILALMNLCPTKYPDYDIPGNDLGGVSGQADQCCEFCKSNSACKAYAWSNWNGGTCWLKSVIGPLVSNTGVTVGIL